MNSLWIVVRRDGSVEIHIQETHGAAMKLAGAATIQGELDPPQLYLQDKAFKHTAETKVALRAAMLHLYRVLRLQP